MPPVPTKTVDYTPKFLVGDCCRLIPELGQFDFIFCDPPFNIGQAYIEYEDNKPWADYRSWTSWWLRRCEAALGPSSVLALHGPDDLAAEYLSWVASCNPPGDRLQRIAWINWHYRFGQCGRSNWIDSRCHCLIYANGDDHTWNPDAVLVDSDRVAYGDKRVKKTTVVNIQKADAEYDVLIDRTTKWGNPFKIGVDGTRTEVIDKYRMWLEQDPELLALLIPELRGKVLGCHCKPMSCHGDVLAELANAGVGGKRLPMTVWGIPSDGKHWGRVTGSQSNGERRPGHPNQLPVKYLERLIRAYTNKGDRVCDPFCGSGTTAAVCQELGRHCVTIDISEQSIASAKERCTSPTCRAVTRERLGL